MANEQYQLLEAYARERGKTVSSLLRESLEITLLATLQQRRREAALRRIKGQQLPIADWDCEVRP